MAQAGKTLHKQALGAQSAERIAAFANVLRANGFALGLAESKDALAVLASPAGRRPALLKPALRALFSATREDWRRFDELFDAFWRGKGMRRVQPLRGAANATRASAGPALRVHARRAARRQGKRRPRRRVRRRLDKRRPARRRLVGRGAREPGHSSCRRPGGDRESPRARRAARPAHARAARAALAGAARRPAARPQAHDPS